MTSLPSFPLSLPWVYKHPRQKYLKFIDPTHSREKRKKCWYLNQQSVIKSTLMLFPPLFRLYLGCLNPSWHRFLNQNITRDRVFEDLMRCNLTRPPYWVYKCQASRIVVDISVQFKRTDEWKLKRPHTTRQNSNRTRTTVSSEIILAKCPLN